MEVSVQGGVSGCRRRGCSVRDREQIVSKEYCGPAPRERQSISATCVAGEKESGILELSPPAEPLRA